MAGRRAHGARPSPRSQHFLRSRALAAQIVREAGVSADDVVLDLGAGTGRLTVELARVARDVVAVEIDPRLASRLRGRWPNVRVFEGDATEMAVPAKPFRVVANLPFARTADLLHLLFDSPGTPLVRADLIVAWEVAVKRAIPWPSTLNGVVWGSTYEMSLGRRLPRQLFGPTPSVDAGLLIARRRAEPLVSAELADAFRSFVATGFRHGVSRVVRVRANGPVKRGTAARDLDAHQWAWLFLQSTRHG